MLNFQGATIDEANDIDYDDVDDYEEMDAWLDAWEGNQRENGQNDNANDNDEMVFRANLGFLRCSFLFHWCC